MSVSIPDGLPTLAKGMHDPNTGEACVMEYVSILAGEEFSDHPACTHGDLAQVARLVNDTLPDNKRHLLVPLIGRLFGTTQDSRTIQDALAEVVWALNWDIDQVGPEAMIQNLSHLIDAYDKAAGRTEVRELSTEELAQLAAAVVPAA